METYNGAVEREKVHVTTLADRVVCLDFSNPSARHALDTEILAQFAEHLTLLASAPNAPVVIVRNPSGDKVWSSGHDLKELQEDRDPLAYGKPLEVALRAVRAYPGVVIAAVSGSVWGGAVDLVMSCDLVIAERNAQFSITPSNIGLPYSTSGLLRFFNNLPVHVLKEMFFCAKPLGIEQAVQHGVVNHVVDKGHLNDAALDYARTIAAKAPLAIRAVKEQLRILEDAVPVPVSAMERIAELRKQACESVDFEEGLRAFSERRTATFCGG
ncbi:methylmalonyl-CoA decarboxylase [Caballeronia sp. LZ001]|uniref:methylmalonyl-CoA decarboxylase n=1 Tax=Caballeronia sp. LZ001 TaxID=3038553 RepID=UPI00285D87E4|nr:methylmalonyl-CoA decarboxylase [Caballeronia sp. LZ001]MDR5804782.1 methylmalonyl-CoA decarboxylase [Caballeronia sp. LZ001]